ncbi:hypothetical protein RHGRI_020346 [Rhododendron griersonianum]|uniref:Uncharacterized protein n=1 Tax=Rhododendron griersonianum TaxID=479676 RepID=A0AAV6JFU9_9ERIC|nr:hypothetical protein RHGRI_020346 [Rhododendron griersonianum]
MKLSLTSAFSSQRYDDLFIANDIFISPNLTLKNDSFLVLLLLFPKNSFLGRVHSLPKLFTANTSAGIHKLAQGLASAPESQVKKLAALVRLSEEKAGGFLATRKDIVAWVQSKAPSLAITS